LSITVEEADEVLFWLEILIESNTIEEQVVLDFRNEGTEILKVLSRARKNR